MRKDDSIFLIYDQHNTSNIFKMTKTKTAVILVMIVCTFGLIFSITDAYPTSEAEVEDKVANNSRLVITHVVKTIEFEVGLMDDDGLVDENATDANATQFYETNIELLNLDLLKEVVDQATGEQTMEPSVQIDQEENKTAQTNQTTS